MNTSALENLDLACAQLGKEIAEKPSKELENLITNALAVLEEQGVYALFLYLHTYEKSKSIFPKLSSFLHNTPKQKPLLPNNEDILRVPQKLFQNLDSLLLARDLLRQSLVYARYHARLAK